ncbi:MAG TPA: DUF4824 family protein [Ideonella sp.]|uniref:DUF4824 family protein n=1 Tax=Ideonella sp. TaxID=1929293 RepID=UPI002E3648DC|nr:DUF4824 family protein [Ideonella sp.]HEX5685439.1 DUF4824 family protein [Ideonella sp.]
MKWTHQTALIAGLALITTTNLVALGGAAYNRSGEPDSVLNVSQRELRPSYAGAGGKENSGLTLQLRWRVLPQAEIRSVYAFDGEGGGAPAWLDVAKMAELGFELKTTIAASGADAARRHDRQLPRDVLVVLELDGPVYQQARERASTAAKEVEAKNERGDGKKDAQEIIDREERWSSRLFAVDVGLDRAALRAKYPDRTKYAIVRGQVRPAWEPSGKAGGGTINNLSAETINVPLQMRGAFEGVLPVSYRPPGDDEGRRFDARLAFGQRLEPWLLSATRQ